MFTEFSNQWRQEMRDTAANTQAQQTETNTNATSLNENNFSVWTWGGLMHMVPEGFRLPIGGKVKMFWDLWYYGDADSKIQPYKFLKGMIDLTHKPDRTLLSKISYVMKSLRKLAITKELLTLTTNITQLSKKESDEVFERIYLDANRQIYSNIETKRIGELSLITFYNQLKKLNSE
jgi:hypothetical protein